MGKLIALLVSLGVLGLVGEVAAPRVAAAALERRVATAVPEADSVDATVGDVPFLPRLATDGVIGSVELVLDDVATEGVTLDRVTFALDDLVVDRSALLTGDVVPEDLRAGRVTVEVSAPELLTELGLPADALPEDLSGSVELDGRVLNFAVDAVADASGVELPPELIPCDPELAIDGRTIRLTCELTGLPVFLEEATESSD